MDNQLETINNQSSSKAAFWNKTVLTFEEAAAYSGLSSSYLYKLTSTGQIPHFKPRSKMIYFNRLELEEWLQQGRVKTAAEIEALANKEVKKLRKK